LAGAAQLLKNIKVVLKKAQNEQKSFVEYKGKSFLELLFSVRIKNVKARPSDPLNILRFKIFTKKLFDEVRGDRKVT